MTGDASTSAPDDVLAPLLDLLVHLPVGLYLDSKGRLDDIVARGRTHTTGRVQLARMIGQFAVTFGRKEVERRIAELFANPAPPAATSTPPNGGEAPPSTEVPITPRAPRQPRSTSSAASKRSVAAEQAVAPGAAKPAAAAKPKPPGAAKRPPALAIEGYDTLAASQVIARLDGLTARQLAAVQRHETANRNRKTILGRIHQLTGP